MENNQIKAELDIFFKPEYGKLYESVEKGSIELFTYEKVKPFYERLGFKEIGRREAGFYGSKSIIMDKKIGNWSDSNLIKKEI